MAWLQHIYLMNLATRAISNHITCNRDLLRLPLARTTKYQDSFRFSRAKIWNTFPLALRSEHDLNKFGFDLKGTLDPSQIEPPILLLYLAVQFFYLLSFFFWYVVVVVVVSPSFRQGFVQTSLTELGTPE